ncbi:hypothetical protein ABZ135_38775 [Streptomyces sp. NPDC006339]|uniref:hypothetical protein n=1 Tax=Streptomyces sp. NPDC006339 TaxID=3156755 RepID=UPI0033B1FF87
MTQPEGSEAHPPRVQWRVEIWDIDGWMPSSISRPDRDATLAQLQRRHERNPRIRLRLIRETTTWTVEESVGGEQ